MHGFYVTAGYRTFPLQGKTPKVKKWGEISFSRTPITGNFGVALDDDILIIDIDVRNGGTDSFRDLCRNTGVNLKSHSNLIVMSGRGDGGCHVYLKKPRDFKIKKTLKKKYPGVDFLSKGCYVVGAGSVHPDTGGFYKILSGSEDNLSRLISAPDALLNIIERKVVAPMLSAEPDEKFLKGNTEAYAKYLQREAEVAIEGESGDTLTFRIACQGREYNLPEEVTFQCMMRFWNPRCSPPWSSEDLHKKVINAYMYAEGSTGSKSLEAVMSVVDYISNVPNNSTQSGATSEVVMTKTDVVIEEGVYTEEVHVPAHLVDYDPEVIRCLKTMEGRIETDYDSKEPKNAVLYSEKYFPDDRIFTYQGDIYGYNGKYFKHLSDDKMQSLIQRELILTGLKLSVIKGTVQGIRNYTFTEQFSQQKNAICFSNGVLVLGEDRATFEKHDQKYYCTDIIDRPFHIDDKAPTRWLKFLSESFENDENRISLLQEWMGYNLIVGNPYQKICLLVGASRSGKGVIARVLNTITKGVGVTLSVLCSEFGLSSLVNKKTAIVGDAHQVGVRNQDRAKEIMLNISGQDQIDVNRKFKPVLNTTLDTKLTLLANSMPTFSDGSDALINRYLVIPFERSFGGKEDVFLSQKLDEEIPSIINWAVEGFYRVFRNNGRFTIGTKSVEALKEIRDISNPIKMFIDKNCVIEKGASVCSNALYAKYKEFTAEELAYSKCLSKPFFAKQLKLVDGHIDITQSYTHHIFKGIKFKESKDEERIVLE